MAWEKVHKASGATMIERSAHGCKLQVMPVDWTDPKGAAHYVVTCGGSDATHARGRKNSVMLAKRAAMFAAKQRK